MISSLRGKISLKDNNALIVDVSGVGYKVFVASSVLSKAGQVGTEVIVFTHTHVREDVLELYGFLEYQDLKLFELLISVSGVGCKTALGVFNNGTRQDIMNAILRADTVFFTGIPRLGKKNAQKIIIELKSKLGSSTELDLAGGEEMFDEEAVLALKSFGFTRKEAQDAIRMTAKDTMSTSERVKMALKYLGK